MLTSICAKEGITEGERHAIVFKVTLFLRYLCLVSNEDVYTTAPIRTCLYEWRNLEKRKPNSKFKTREFPNLINYTAS